MAERGLERARVAGLGALGGRRIRADQAVLAPASHASRYKRAACAWSCGTPRPRA